MNGSSPVVAQTTTQGSIIADAALSDTEPDIAIAAPAVTTAPTTAVPTRGTDSAVELPTPKQVYRSLVVAMNQGDRDAIAGLLAVRDEEERRVALTLANYAQALAHVREVAAKVYGTAIQGFLGTDEASLDAALVKVDAAEERISDDMATLVDPADKKILTTLRRVDGHWKVVMDASALRESDKLVRELELQIVLMDELADEMARHKFVTADEATQVFAARMLRPSTQPGTQPTTRP